jgi:hypothetical protein
LLWERFYAEGYYAVNRTDVVTFAIRRIPLGLNMLCNSAASGFITMRRLKNNSLGIHAIRRALHRAGTAALLLGLSGPAFAAHHTHHAAAPAPAKMPVALRTTQRTTKTPAATPVAATRKASTHPHTIAVKSEPRRVHSAGAKRHNRQETAQAAPVHTAPIVEKPSAADFEAAARVHAWETSHSATDATPAATQPPAPIVHATSEDFIRASQPQSNNVLPDESPAPVATPAPVPKPVHDSLRAPKNSKAAPQPLTPAVAKMLPGSDKETTPALADAEAQLSPMIAPAMVPLVYNRRGRLIMPAALKGSHDILVHQNEMADAEGLDRIQDDDDLARKVADKELVRIPASAMLHVDERLPDNRRYCRPWVAQFLTDIARAHYARFHTPLQVNSAVRTVEFQERLRRTNGNAAPIDGDTASPHLTGFAIDIAKHPLSQTEIAWMRGYLLPLEHQGKIDVEEEFQQACFHMSVYAKYVPAPSKSPKRSQPAVSTTNVLATSLQ